jgi:hypothetical protein
MILALSWRPNNSLQLTRLACGKLERDSPAKLCENEWAVARAAGQLSSRPLCAARRLYLPDPCRASNAPSTAASLACRGRVVPAVARGDGPWPAKESPREAGMARDEVLEGKQLLSGVAT